MKVLLILFIALFLILTVKTFFFYLHLLRETNLPINSNLIIGSFYIGFRLSLVFMFGFVRCAFLSVIALLTLIIGDEVLGKYSFKDCKNDWMDYIYFIIKYLN